MEIFTTHSPKNSSKEYSNQMRSIEDKLKKSKVLFSLSDLETPNNPYKSFRNIDEILVTADKKYENKQIDKLFNNMKNSFSYQYFQKLCHLLKSKDNLYYKKRKLLENLKYKNKEAISNGVENNNLYITLQNFRELNTSLQNNNNNNIRTINIKNVLDTSKSEKIVEDLKTEKKISDKIDNKIPEFYDNELSDMTEESQSNSLIKPEQDSLSIENNDQDGQNNIKELYKLLNTKKDFKKKINTKLNKKHKSMDLRGLNLDKKKADKEIYLSLLPVKNHMKKLDEKMRQISDDKKRFGKKIEIYKIYNFKNEKKHDSKKIVEITQRIKFFEARRDEYLHKMMYSNKEASRKNGIDNTINHTLIKNKSNLKNYDLRRAPKMEKLVLPKIITKLKQQSDLNLNKD